MNDPNPLVAGRGCESLKGYGIKVQTGLMEEEARTLNIGFVTRMTLNRPWVRMKIAASIDGKTALKSGASQWITSEPARCDGHRWRARSCAVLTGIGTILKDNSQLTVRHVETPRQPLRVVVDSRLEIKPDARVLRGEGELVFTANASEGKIADLVNVGAQPIMMPNAIGGVDLVRMMSKLADYEINELLVEAGSKLSGSLIREGLVDELVIYLAPCLIGDSAQGMMSLPELENLSDKKALTIRDLRMIGTDIRIIAQVRQ